MLPMGEAQILTPLPLRRDAAIHGIMLRCRCAVLCYAILCSDETLARFWKSVSMCIHIYIYIYVHTYTYIIYIHIYIYVFTKLKTHNNET